MEDPEQLKNTKTAAGLLPDLSLGVWGGAGKFYPARVIEADSGGTTYQATIPLDTFVYLHITSLHLKLADSNGTTRPGNNSLQRFQHKTGDTNPQNFSFSITGLN